MREFSFVADRLEDMSRELAISNHTGFLHESNRRVKNLVAADAFYIDVFKHTAAGGETRQWAEAFINTPVAGHTIIIKDENTAPVRYFEQALSAAAVIAFDETLYNSDKLKEIISFFADQYKLVVIINFFDEAVAKRFARQFGLSVTQVVIPAAGCTGKNADELLRSVVTDAMTLNKFKKFTYINSIKPLFAALDEIFSSENRAVQTRKLLNSQNVQILRKDEQGVNQMDFLNNIRQLIQKFGQDLDKSLRTKYDELNKPNTGEFSLLAQQQVTFFKDFKREKMAEKPEKLAVTIEDSFKEAYINKIGRSLKSAFDKDEQFVSASVEDLLSKINIQLKQKNIAPVSFTDVETPMPDKKRVISSYCYFSRQYNGEIIKKGPYEYFIALRDYIGVIMVATGLLAPLNMIASLGDDSESFFHFLKDMNKFIKLSTAVIAISLIVYGIYDLRKRIPRKREEEFNREMVKAKELMMAESKRMCSEATRDWSSNILTWVKEVGQNITNQIDRNAKAQQSSKMQQMNQDKMVQQRQQQSIDLLQKNIQAAERIKEQLATRFREVVSETEKNIKL